MKDIFICALVLNLILAVIAGVLFLFGAFTSNAIMLWVIVTFLIMSGN